MIPIWWALVAFMAGGCAGLLLFALMRSAAEQDAPPPLSTELRNAETPAGAPSRHRPRQGSGADADDSRAGASAESVQAMFDNRRLGTLPSATTGDTTMKPGYSSMHCT